MSERVGHVGSSVATPSLRLKRRRNESPQDFETAATPAGRWSLLVARRVEINIAEHAARQFLRRYGVVFRDPLRAGQEIRLSAADPLNLAGVILPGPRVPSNPSNYIVYRNGVAVTSGETSNVETINSQVG